MTGTGVREYKVRANVGKIRYEPFGLDCPDNILPPTECGDLWELIRVEYNQEGVGGDCHHTYKATWKCSSIGQDFEFMDDDKTTKGKCPPPQGGP